MLFRFLFLVLLAANALAVSRTAQTRELQRLVHLPALELPALYQFDRGAGLLPFFDRAQTLQSAAVLFKETTGTDPAPYLKTARLYDQAGNHALALKFYAQAADLFRNKLESQPQEITALCALVEILQLLGNPAEAQAHLDQALAHAPASPETLSAAAQFHAAQAWAALGANKYLFGSLDFISSVETLVEEGLSGSLVSESRRHLELALHWFNRAVEARDPGEELLLARAAFHSFAAVLNRAFLSSPDTTSDLNRELHRELFNDRALADLERAAALPSTSPETLARLMIACYSQALFNTFSGTPPSWEEVVSLSPSLHEVLQRLGQATGSEEPERAGLAHELLGCVQLYLIQDFPGASRSFRQALAKAPGLGRSWDLLALSLAAEQQNSALVAACQERHSAAPSSRSRLFLAKACELAGSTSQAELHALAALSAGPNDFFANLTLAAFLLKRENYENYTWKIRECLRKAERNLPPNATPRNHLDLAATRVIFHALTREAPNAVTVLKELSPELQNSPRVRQLRSVLGLGSADPAEDPYLAEAWYQAGPAF